MTYSAREVERDQSTHDHYARNARSQGHAETCDLVAGHWTTVQGVGVNWPTINGRPSCTCGTDPSRKGWTTRSLERAVDQAIAAENRRFLADPQAVADAQAEGETYRLRLEAEGILPPLDPNVRICPACGLQAAAPGDRYCADCGSASDRSAWVDGPEGGDR